MKNLFYAVTLFLFFSLTVVGQTYTSTGSMNTDRFAHETQLLYTGKVLAFGGDNFNALNDIVYRSAQLYNPSTGTWSNTGSMNKLRTNFASVVLPDGNIMAIGGEQTTELNALLASCEIYNVQTGIWSYTDSMNVARAYHAAISLKNGQVLVVGGFQENTNTITCELYNPSTNKWSSTGSPSLVGEDGTCLVMLADGKILATFGHDAEIYNPDTETWTLLSSKLVGFRQDHSSVLLNNGNVLITGGSYVDYQTTAEIFNYSTMTFTATAEMGANRASSKAILLDNGKVLTYGLGDFTSSVNTKMIELYDPATGTWSGQVYHTVGTQGYNINKLGNGKILISGGSNTVANGATTACFLIDQNLTACSLPSITGAVSGQSTCYGNGSTITLNTSENGVIYTVKLSNTNIVQSIGTGSALTISVPPSAVLSGDNVYTVYANNTGCTSLALADTAVIKAAVTIPKPTITSSGNSICVGDSAKLSAPTGYSSYKWNTHATTAFIYAKIVNDFFVEVTSSNGCKSLPSDVTHISTNPILTTSVLITANQNPIVAGDLATFTATSVNAGTAPVYEWRINNILTGTSSNTLSSTAINNGDIISCTLISNAVCPKPQAAVSNSIAMIVTPYVDYPRVLSTSPAANAVSISNKQSIAITFSKSMLVDSSIDSLIRIFGSYSGKIKGTYTGNGTNTIVFTPSQYSNPGEKISVLIDSTLKDNVDIPMKNGYIFEMTVAAAPAPGEFVDGSEIADLINPVKIIPADFDNDQQMDFISYNYSPAGIQIWMNQGNGTYNTSQSIAAQYTVSDIGVADLNNDGHIDIYISYSGNSTLSILFNNNLVFTKKDFIMESGSEKIIPGDFDGDADIDLAIKGTSSPAMIFIQQNDGKGNFNIGNYKLNTSGNNFRAGDFDNDGDLDVIVSSSIMQFLQNNGKGVFTTTLIPLPVLLQPYPYSEIVSMGDYDNNGYLDIIVQLEKTIGIIKNTGNGNFLAYDSIGNFLRGAQNSIMDYPSADFDGDGDLDFGYTNWKTFSDPPNDSIDIWTNNSNGKFTLTKRSLVGTNTGLYNLIPMDIDGDGDIDIAFTNRYLKTTFLKLNGGTKTTVSITSPNTNQLCVSNPMNIAFKKTGTFNTGNVFKLQLSDKNGSFATPIEIGSTSSNSNLSIPTLIPPSVLDGTQYRMRIVSTDPAIISTDNGFDIAISSNCFILSNVTPLANTQDAASSQIVIANFTQQPSLPTSGINIYGSFTGSYLNKGTLSTNGNSLVFTPANYFPGEKITTTLDSSIKSTSGKSLVNPSTSNFTVKSNAAPALFTPLKSIDSGNTNLYVLYLNAVGDMNSDGKIDVIAIEGSTNNLNIYFNNGDGTYNTVGKTIYPQSPSGGTVLDWDNDGDLDVVIKQSFGNILILKNDGQANFTLAQTISTTCYSLKYGDLNNDGFPDIVSITNNANFSIFLNNKNGDFYYSSTIQVNEPIISSDINDIDNDGDQDLLLGTTSNLYAFANIGKGIIFQKRTISTGFWGSNLVVTDLNNDKLPDIAGDSNGSLKIIFNDINNSFTTSKLINFNSAAMSNLTAADFNGDNNMDLLFQSTYGNSLTYIVLNDGTGTFPVTRQIKNNEFALPADVDNDGDIDLVSFTNVIGMSIRSLINYVELTTTSTSSTNFCSGKTINVQFTSRGIPEDILYKAQLSDATGSFTTPVTIGTSKTSPIMCSLPASIPFGNGYRIRVVCDSINFVGTDNGADLTISTDCPSVNSLSPAPNANGANINATISATFTKNMLPGNANSFRVFKGYSGFTSTKGTFSSPNPTSLLFNSGENYFAGEKVSVTLTTNIQNTDHTPLTSPFVYNFNIQPKATSGTFYMKEDVFTNFNQLQMAVKSADFDNDGDLDLVTLNSYENKVSIRLNNNGYFSTKTDYTCGQNPIDLAISDIDSDGDADIITANYSGQHISVFKNNGDATFVLTASLRLRDVPYNITSADFDGDGDMDFATQSGCYLNDGTGNFTAAILLPYLGNNTYSSYFTSGDIDSDGDIDIIATAFGATYSVITYTNNGDASFTRKDTYTVPDQINYMYTGDFNNDGKIDFAACIGSNNTIVLGMNANGTYSIGTIQTEKIAHRIGGGDIDGDGDLDLLVSNVTPYGLSILKNNGVASFTSSQYIDMINLQPYNMEPFDIDNDGDLDIAMTGASELRLLLNEDPSITTLPITNSSICVGEEFNISFTQHNIPIATTIIAELSDATGSFANNPTTIGVGTDSPLRVAVPTNTVVGNAYRIRIVCNDLAVIGSDNGTNLNVIQNCLAITSLAPYNNSHNFASINSIETNFTTDLTPSSVNAQSMRIYGSYSGFNSNKGTISLSDPSSILFQSNENFFPNERISVSLTTQLKNVNNINLQKPFVYDFYVKPAASSGNFFLKQSTLNSNLQGVTAKSVESGDIDNDGDLDILMVNPTTNQLSIYLNHTNQPSITTTTSVNAFPSKIDLNCGYQPQSICLIDMDADGDLDIFTLNMQNISVFKNNGAANFILTTTLTLSDSPKGITAADFNGDGITDFATFTASTGLSININNGSGTFTENTFAFTTAGIPSYLTYIDVDADGDMDIIGTTKGQYVANLLVFENDGLAHFSLKNNISTGIDQAFDIQIADFNNDKKMDFITSRGYANGGFDVGFNQSNSFTMQHINYLPYYQDFYDIADVDGDGDIDIICSSRSYTEGLTIMKNDGHGAFTSSGSIPVNTPILAFIPNDVDNDGDIDIVSANTDIQGLLVFYNGAAPVELSTGTINVSSTSIRIYPNPAHDLITIDSPDMPEQIILYNVLGNEVLKANQTNQVNVSELIPGIYNIKVITNKGTVMQKICIE